MSGTRREFLGASTIGLFTTSLWPQVSATTSRANDRIGAGVIGLGIMGYGHLQHLTFNRNNWGIEVRAGCDVYDLLRERAASFVQKQTGHDLVTYNDFRELLCHRDIDAVFIATPDHWHALMAVEACKAGKDIYVQKPISVDTYESRMMVEAVRKYNRVCQVGTQQPSWQEFKDAIALVRSGILGKIMEVKTFIYGMSLFSGPFNAPFAEPPAGLDWQMWLGPAARPPFGPSDEFNANVFGVYVKTSGQERSGYGDTLRSGNLEIRQEGTWRLFWPAGGLQTDWGIHLTDIVLRAMQAKGPRSISSHGRNFIYYDNRQVPDIQNTIWEFDDFFCRFELRSGNNHSHEGLPERFDRSHGIVFYGMEGTLFVNRTGYVVYPQPNKKIEPPNINGTVIALEGKHDDKGDDAHVKNFFDCMRSRQDPIAPIEVGRYATDMCIAANAAMRCGRRLDWDAETGTATVTAAHPFLRLSYRQPWRLEV